MGLEPKTQRDFIAKGATGRRSPYVTRRTDTVRREDAGSLHDGWLAWMPKTGGTPPGHHSK